MTVDANAALYSGVSGSVPTGTPAATAAPGATGPGGQMPIENAVIGSLLFLGGAYVALGVLFRRGQGLPPLRIDAAAALASFLGVEVFRITTNVVAYHYHGHKWAQAWLMVG